MLVHPIVSTSIRRVAGPLAWAALLMVLTGPAIAARPAQGPPDEQKAPAAAPAPPQAKQNAAAPAPAPVQPVLLNVDAAPAPVPALKYRLLPSFAELRPGDAAPIYLRFAHPIHEAAYLKISENVVKWSDLTLDRFPVAEAREIVKNWESKLEQIEFASRRKTCDWNYTFDEQRLDIINVMLPDAQSMRDVGRLLWIKTRLEIAEGKLDAAIGTMETSLALARHVNEGPFLINGLVGVALATVALHAYDELVVQPGAPNLYWALTALPRPLIGLRRSLEIERNLFENLVPELKEVERDETRSAVEWAALLERMHRRVAKWAATMHSFAKPDNLQAAFDLFIKMDLAGFKAAVLSEAKAHWAQMHAGDGPGAEKRLAAVSDDELIARYLADGHREIWDEHFKAAYLPTREALARLAELEQRESAAPRKGPMAVFAAFIPAVRAGIGAELRLDRRVAALRAIEALRLYAAAHQGALPDSFEQIQEVPVPDDPWTGRPFIYRAADSAAILHGERIADFRRSEFTYRIIVRPMAGGDQ